MAELVTILCVDDEPDTLTAEKALLESAGFRVLSASSGREAMATLRREQIDIVLMDYWMPGMNGITAAQNMKAVKPEVPIIFVSAYSELPGETVGIAECWVTKSAPEQLLSRLRLAAKKATFVRRARAS